MESMKLRSGRFGEISISEQDIFTFPRGIPGFENQKSFVVVAPEKDEPFAFLQSAVDEHLVFVIVDPFLFYPGYDFEIPESALAEMRIESEEQVIVRVIVNVQDKLEEASVNLVAPIVLNVKERLGKQVVLEKTNYTTKHYLFAVADR